MRLLLLALVTTVGYAHADDRHMLPDSAMRAVEAQRTAEATGVPQIINGVFTAAYPAVARLNIWTATSEFLCTGTLVSPSTILTAAHCVADDPVRIDADFFTTATTGISYAAVAYAIHPEYLGGNDADLAVLWLEAPVVGITPVPLAGWKPRPRTVGTIVGYGLDEVGNLGVKEMGTVRLKRCPRRMRALDIWPGELARDLCWSRRPWQQDTCKGDSGGPLLVGGAVAGVTSAGDANCTGLLSWDTSVVEFLPWITNMLL